MEVCEFVNFEIAKKLKEKGFKEKCLACYIDDTLYYNYSNKNSVCYKDCYLSHNLMPENSVSGKFVDAPTIPQVLKWLREEKGLHIAINNIWGGTWGYDLIEYGRSLHWTAYREDIKSYEDAALDGIKYVIDVLI